MLSGDSPVNPEDLRNKLAALHAQLSNADEIDAETQAMLQTATSDIQRLLEAGSTQTAANESDHSLPERLRNTLIEFEARDSHFGGLLERITDAFSTIRM